MGNSLDIAFLIVGIACFLVMLSIRNELRRMNRPKKKSKSEWSYEDMEKHRVRYLYQCRHLRKHA